MEPAAVQPETARTSEPLVPNQYELLGSGVSINFSTTSITGQPLLHYQDACREVNARGDEIRQEETEIGTLVTITLEPDADAGSLLFTVLIPRAVIEGVGSELRIITQGILTRSRFARGPAADAQLQEYRVVTLRGHATFVIS
jgi:hypothetical protein